MTLPPVPVLVYQRQSDFPLAQDIDQSRFDTSVQAAARISQFEILSPKESPEPGEPV
jgi:hypothetical protein